MNKKELVKTIAEKTETTQKAVAEVVDTLFDVIEDTLMDGEDVSIANFGKFVVIEKEASTKRNPLTGAPVEVPAHNVVKFKTSSVLKSNVK